MPTMRTRRDAGPDPARSADAPAGFVDLYERAYPGFARERRAAGSAPLTLVRADHDSHETVTPGASDLALGVLLDGGASHVDVDFGDGRMVVPPRAGSFNIPPPRTDSDWRAEGPHRLLILVCPLAPARALMGADGRPGTDPLRALYGRTLADREVLALVRRLWREAGGDGAASSLMTDALFAQVLAALLRLADERPPRPTPGEAAPLDPRRLARVEAYVEAYLGEPLTVAELAGVAGVSTFHFSRAFKAATGLTPHAFVTRRRMARARVLLEAGRLPLARVARACGFASQSAFGQAFRSHTGLTPGACRAGGHGGRTPR